MGLLATIVDRSLYATLKIHFPYALASGDYDSRLIEAGEKEVPQIIALQKCQALIRGTATHWRRRPHKQGKYSRCVKGVTVRLDA